MKIRSVEKSDFDKLAKLYVEAYNPLNIGEHWDVASAKKLLFHLYSAQPDLFFVVEDNDKVIGAINAIVKPWWDGYHITDGEVFIHPKHQGKGIGKKLIKHLFGQAKKKYQAVSWDTFTHIVHEHPMKWYKSLGFEEIREWAMITGNINQVLNNLKEKLTK